jgi:hypothetical protein
MSERAEGFIVLGATRAQVQRWLAEQRLAAFLATGPGKALRVWPRAKAQAAEAAAGALTGALEGSRVLVWSVGKEEARLAVYAQGECLVSGEVALRLRTAKQLSHAHAALQRVSAAVESKHRAPPLLRDEASLPSFLALVGAAEEDVAGLHYAGLAEARRQPEAPGAERFHKWVHVDEAGQVSPFL